MSVITAHLSLMVSALPTAASALVNAISALESSIRALETSSEELETLWLPLWTTLVVIGVFAEVWAVIREHDDAKKSWARGIITPPEKPSTFMFWIGLIGAVLVALGVAGELGASFRLASINGQLRGKNSELRVKTEQLIGFSNAQAIDAASASAEAKGSARDAKEQASNASGLASTAALEAKAVREDVAKASTDLAQLRNESQSLQAETEKTKSDLIDASVCEAPRVITNWIIGTGAIPKTYVDKLRPMAGQKIVVEYIPFDAEARRAALSIANALIDAKWDLQKPLTMIDGLPDGVSVQPFPYRPDINTFSVLSRATINADSLVEFLHSYNWTARRDFGHDRPDTMPPGSVRVQIGLYPAVSLAKPIGQKEIDDAMEAGRREREEEARRGRSRRRAEVEANMSPEQRKAFEKREAEWDEMTKKEIEKYTAQPCKALSMPTY